MQIATPLRPAGVEPARSSIAIWQCGKDLDDHPSRKGRDIMTHPSTLVPTTAPASHPGPDILTTPGCPMHALPAKGTPSNLAGVLLDVNDGGLHTGWFLLPRAPFPPNASASHRSNKTPPLDVSKGFGERSIACSSSPAIPSLQRPSPQPALRPASL